MIARTAIALALAGAVVDPAAVRETEQFRTKHEADYRRDYVTLAGLFSLHDGVNTVGSAATNAIILPKPAAGDRRPADRHGGPRTVRTGQVRHL